MSDGVKSTGSAASKVVGLAQSEGADPWDNVLHVYGQYYCHCDAEVRGTRKALEALQAAIGVALETGRAEMITMAADGEGYRLAVTRTNTTGMNAGGCRHYTQQAWDDGHASAAKEWRAEWKRANGLIRQLNEKLRAQTPPQICAPADTFKPGTGEG